MQLALIQRIDLQYMFEIDRYQGPILQTWFNSHPSMDK